MYGDPKREFSTATHETGATIEYHVVTDDTKGTVSTLTENNRQVNPGDVLVKTNRPDLYDVYPSDAFDNLGYKKEENTNTSDWETNSDTVLADDYDGDDESDFDPSTATATEIRAYLSRTDVSESEKERVREAERNGLNRASALR